MGFQFFIPSSSQSDVTFDDLSIEITLQPAMPLLTKHDILKSLLFCIQGNGLQIGVFFALK